MLELRSCEKRENMKEEVRLAQKLKEVLESLYDSTRCCYIVDHALAAYLLRREEEVLRELPDNPQNLGEALATLLVANDAKHALKAVEVLEKRYRKRLKSTFPYSIIALDILLDKGFSKPAKRLCTILGEAGITSIAAPAEDTYIAFAVFERVARSLGIPSIGGGIKEKPETTFRALVDFVLRGDQKVLNYTEYQSILGWISAQLKEEHYIETYDDIEIFSAEIPPPLFFSPARLYIVWKFLMRALKLEVTLPSYVLDDSSRKILVDALKKRRRYEKYKLEFLSFVENFLFTLVTVAISTAIVITVPLSFIAVIIVGVAEKYAEKNLRKYKLYIPGFSRIKNKRKEVELRLHKIENLLERYTKVFGID